ncbi:MAG: hypothetical protein VX780_04385 [Pseudomonadota bacterium]|nr:hypothetical protein [Pseudomonadota bacterium]
MQRYILGATLFALLWATIAYTQQGITDIKKLVAMVLVFIVMGSILCWLLAKFIQWFKNFNE